MARKLRDFSDPMPMPPDLGDLGAIAFTSEDRDVLATWLGAPGWPKGSMDMTTLDGYLTALVAWPIALPPGAWLPSIWNGAGWRLPENIRSSVSYHKFIILIVGYLQEIDRALSAALPACQPSLRVGARVSGRPVRPEVGWATGFQKALALGASGVDRRSPAITRAVTTIAHLLSPSGRTRAPVHDPRTALMEAVLTLAAERTSRGPLGRLPDRPKGG